VKEGIPKERGEKRKGGHGKVLKKKKKHVRGRGGGGQRGRKRVRGPPQKKSSKDDVSGVTGQDCTPNVVDNKK